MFAGKIEGDNRAKLLQHLNILYCEGYDCLLRCQSLEQGFSFVIELPTRAFLHCDRRSVIGINIICECLDSEFRRINYTETLKHSTSVFISLPKVQTMF